MKFINLTAHALTADQIAAAKDLGVNKFLEAADVLPANVLEKLRNCPDEAASLELLAKKVIEAVNQVADGFTYVHLPCGSPALMWAMAGLTMGQNPHLPLKLTPVFSHSVRESVEEIQPNGTVMKRSVFRFESFILF